MTRITTPASGRFTAILAVVLLAFATLVATLCAAGSPTHEQGPPATTRPAASTRARILFNSHRLTGAQEIWVMNDDGTEPAQVTRGGNRKGDPAWSADGARFAYYAEVEGNRDIFVQSCAADAVVVQLTNDPAADEEPSWSPDGSTIAFTSQRDGHAEIYAVSTTGDGAPRRLTDTKTDNWRPHWSPDGQRIVFQSERDGNTEIYTMKRDGSDVTRLTHTAVEEYQPKWSPDGKWIAFASERDGPGAIFIMTPLGADIRRVSPRNVEVANAPCWSPDSQHVAFMGVVNGDAEICCVGIDGTDLRVFRSPGYDAYPAWSLSAVAQFGQSNTEATSAAPPVARGQTDAAREEIEIPMRDGVRLVADLWLSSNSDGPVPIMLVRSPYGRRSEHQTAREWVRQGYGVVVQAVRGRDGSQGAWLPWEADLADGYDTIDWIARQSWCNGRVGMWGGSYLGSVQILAAAAGHPALACIAPMSPGSDVFSDVPYCGGILKLGLMGWLYVCRGPTLDASGVFPPSAHDGSLEALPVAAIDAAWSGLHSDIWQRWVRIETLADAPTLQIWDELRDADHKVPALHIDGLWDHESMGTRRNWEQFLKHGGEDQYLILGPWPHDPNRSQRYADVDYGDEAIVDLAGIQQSWYRHWLEDGPDPAFPRVRMFATGINRWLHLDGWPDSRARLRQWYVARNDDDGADGYTRCLASAPPASSFDLRWSYDPADVQLGRDLYFGRTTRLWFDGRDPDALVIATQPFAEDTLLLGPGEIEFMLQSSAEDTSIFALIVGISETGEIRALQRPSPLCACFREGFDEKRPLVPNRPHRVRLPLGLFAHVFQKNSRLGLAIRSDWFPAYARNLGTLDPLATASRKVLQQNRIISTPETPTVLRLYELPLQAPGSIFGAVDQGPLKDDSD